MNAMEPGTHMITPARAWSSSGESPRSPAPGRVRGIDHAVREGENGREQRGLRLGEQEIHDHPPPWPCLPRRPGQDHRMPEEQRCQEEARVLDVVPEVGSQRQIVQRGRMPGPERDDERHPRDARLREDAGEPPHRPCRQHRGHRVPRGKREPRKQRRHWRAQPEQRGRHHHQQEVLDHVRLERPVAQRVDRRADRHEHDAESRRERHRAPGPEALGHARPERRPAAQVERGRRDHRHDHRRLEAPRERDGLRDQDVERGRRMTHARGPGGARSTHARAGAGSPRSEAPAR